MDMRFDGVNYFAADARLHYGSVSIKDGYIDRVDMADAAPHDGAKLLLPGRIGRRTQGACAERHNGLPFRHDGNG